MYKKNFAWAAAVVMALSFFIAIPIQAQALIVTPVVVKNICDAEVLPDGDIAIVYVSEGEVYYGELDPSTNTWEKQEIAAGKNAALALDSSGNPHLAYIDENDDLRYTYFNGTSWSAAKTIDSLNFNDVEGVLTYPDIAIDANGYAHITYLDSKAGYKDDNNYASYDKDDLMYAVNAGPDGNFVVQVRSYSHGWFYSPDGWRNLVYAPPKITIADGQYCIGAKTYNYDKDMYGQYHTYSYVVFLPTSNTPDALVDTYRSSSINNDLGFKLFGMDTDGVNAVSFYKKSGTLYLTNGVTEDPAATKTFACVAGDLFIDSMGLRYYAAINEATLLLYQDGYIKENLTLPSAISSTNYNMATVVSGNKQYVLYTDTSGNLWVCGVSNLPAGTEVSTYKIPDKETVTISGVNVSGKVYDGEAVSATGTPVATITSSGDTADISTYDYTWYDVTNSATLTQAPTAAGSYKLTISVPSSNSTYTGSAEMSFAIAKKTITISGVAATDRAYNSTTSVAITGGTLAGVVELDDVSANVPAAGSIANANAADDKTVTIAAITLSGTDAANYTLTQPSGIKVDISKADISINGVTVDAKTYDGTTAATVSNVAFSGLQGGETLAATTDYTVSATFADANAGVLKTVSCSISLKDTTKANNYNLESGTCTGNADITKASGLVAIDPATIKVYKGMEKEYSYDLSTIGLNKTDTGTVTYSLGGLTSSGLFSVNPAISEDGKTMTYTSANVVTATANQLVGISTQNYQNATANLSFVAVDKEAVTITGVTVTSKVYDGAAISYTGTPSATVTESSEAVTIASYSYTWYDVTNSTTLLVAPKNAGSYKLTVFVSDSTSIYTGYMEIPFSILKKDLTIKPADKSILRDEALPELTVEYVGLVSGENASDVISFSEDLTMQIQDGSAVQLIDSSVVGTYDIVFTNSPEITSQNYNITTADGTLTIAKPPVVMHYEFEDTQTGIKVLGLDSKINVPEKDGEDVEEITLTVKVKKATGDSAYEDIFESCKGTLEEKGYILLNAFDIKIVKQIKDTEGQITEVEVDNEDINGEITLYLPIPEDLVWEGNIGVAYIDDEGNVQLLTSKKVNIDGKYYLEFQTDHFSIYGIVGIKAAEIPTTGESYPAAYYLLGLIALAAGAMLIKKRRSN